MMLFADLYYACDMVRQDGFKICFYDGVEDFALRRNSVVFAVSSFRDDFDAKDRYLWREVSGFFIQDNCLHVCLLPGSF